MLCLWGGRGKLLLIDLVFSSLVRFFSFAGDKFLGRLNVIRGVCEVCFRVAVDGRRSGWFWSKGWRWWGKFDFWD